MIPGSKMLRGPGRAFSWGRPRLERGHPASCREQSWHPGRAQAVGPSPACQWSPPWDIRVPFWAGCPMDHQALLRPPGHSPKPVLPLSLATPHPHRAPFTLFWRGQISEAAPITAMARATETSRGPGPCPPVLSPWPAPLSRPVQVLLCTYLESFAAHLADQPGPSLPGTTVSWPRSPPGCPL